jgi:glyoxylase-like metal-dependent hydrolase (beta-lactamase superfamily II)
VQLRPAGRAHTKADQVVTVPDAGVLFTGDLADVRDYLELLRDETWVRRDSAMSEATITEEVTALMIGRHPEWEGREWIQPGVSCLCTEHAS